MYLIEKLILDTIKIEEKVATTEVTFSEIPDNLIWLFVKNCLIER